MSPLDRFYRDFWIAVAVLSALFALGFVVLLALEAAGAFLHG